MYPIGSLEIAKLVEALTIAGEEIQKVRASAQLNTQVKEDKSPVTRADLLAHEVLLKHLKKIHDIPLVSEEDSYQQISAEYYWLIDPLDGTKEFIAQRDDYTVNVALIRKNIPVVGLIYHPPTKGLYLANKGYGAFYLPHNCRNFELMRTSSLTAGKTIRYLASHRHSEKELERLKKRFPGSQFTKVGSSYKFCLIAKGEADLFIRTGPTCEWDTAAGQVILEEAGGKLVNFEGKPLAYNKPSPLNPRFLAAGDRSFELSLE
jgi:3'(2'), 5'-bisphosphate nucleotidase